MLYKHVHMSIKKDGEIEIPLGAICISITPVSNPKWMYVSWLEPIIKETIIHVRQ